MSMAVTIAIAVFSIACLSPVESVDQECDNLASDTAWTLSVDGGEFRPVIVPGGGWNSDKQPAPGMRPLTRYEEPDGARLKSDLRCGGGFRPHLAKHNQDSKRPVVVKDHVVYRRDLTIPANWTGGIIQLEFGGVNYGAEIFLGGDKVGEHVGPMMPFTVDLTGVAQPGKTYRLEVKAYHGRHYNIDGMCQVPIGFDYEYWRTMHDPSWTAKAAHGIVKYVHLKCLPLPYVKDVFVRTSVKNRILCFDVTLANGTEKPVELELSSSLSSWNKADWDYPSIPKRTVSVPGKGEAKVTVDGIPWNLGPRSYWWPNVPFREDYTAQLHNLNIALSDKIKLRHAFSSRFGFVLHGEGPYYYIIKGVPVNDISDGTTEAQLSEYDAYAEPAGYRTVEACRGTWERFLRAGINANRVCQSTPTQMVMDAADEFGFMLIPETGLRGCHNQGWNPVHSSQSVRELIALTRSHPSVVRYSLQNEMPYDQKEWARLIDAGTETDPTSPLVMEDNTVGCQLPLKHAL